MKVYVCNNGQKSIFHEGKVDKATMQQILAEVKWYFEWRRVKIWKDGDEIYLMNADTIDRFRRTLFEKKEVAV